MSVIPGGGATAVTRQAAEISRRVGRPVKIIWSREEDIKQDKQRAPVYARLTAALGEDGLRATDAAYRALAATAAQ